MEPSNYGIEIYEERFGIDYLVGSFDRETDTDQATRISMTNLKKDGKYYFKIVPTEYISGSGYWKAE